MRDALITDIASWPSYPVPPSPPGPKPLYGGGGYYSWSMHYENQMANKLKMALDKKRGQLAVLLKNKEIYSNGFQTRENKYKLLAINTKLIKVNKEIKSLTKQLENL